MSDNPYQSPSPEPVETPSPRAPIQLLPSRDPSGRIPVWYQVMGGLLIAYSLYSGTCTGLLYYSNLHKSQVVSESFQAIIYALLPIALLGAGASLFFSWRWVLAIGQVFLFVSSLLLALKSVLWTFMLFQEAPADVEPLAFWIGTILVFLFELLPSLLAMVATFFTAAKVNAIVRPDADDG